MSAAKTTEEDSATEVESTPVGCRPTDVDWGYRVILAGVIAIVIWIFAMPLVPSVAESTMRRFHLQSGSYAVWSAQFPIPGMYNFANRYQIKTVPPTMVGDGLLSEFATPPNWRYANHFPTRVFTFADGRYKRLMTGQPVWFDIDSRYRGQTLTSHFECRPNPDGKGYLLLREPAQWDSGAETANATQSTVVKK